MNRKCSKKLYLRELLSTKIFCWICLYVWMNPCRFLAILRYIAISKQFYLKLNRNILKKIFLRELLYCTKSLPLMLFLKLINAILLLLEIRCIVWTWQDQYYDRILHTDKIYRPPGYITIQHLNIPLYICSACRIFSIFVCISVCPWEMRVAAKSHL